jgi:ADP-ribose pyrophosphatase YjhB (NUDIX family)
LGERVEDAVIREVKEETDLDVVLEGLLDVGTDIYLDARSRPRYHYVLVDYLARRVEGRVKLNAESSAFGWFTAEQTRKLDTSDLTKQVLALYFGSPGIAGKRSARNPSGFHSH